MGGEPSGSGINRKQNKESFMGRLLRVIRPVNERPFFMPGRRKTWTISDMQMTNRRIADIATGGEARKKAVLSERRIVTTGYRIRRLISQRVDVMAVPIKDQYPALDTASEIL